MKKHQHGFSLVELMTVVAIMGIIAAIALPKFSIYQSKAKRTEAQNLLSQIYSLMSINYNESSSYSKKDNEDIVAVPGRHVGRINSQHSICNFDTNWPSQIGFAFSPCVEAGNIKHMPFYAYWLYSVDQNSFLAIAQDPTGLVNKCSDSDIRDELSIDQQKRFSIRVDGINCIHGSSNATSIELGSTAP